MVLRVLRSMDCKSNNKSFQSRILINAANSRHTETGMVLL